MATEAVPFFLASLANLLRRTLSFVHLLIVLYILQLSPLFEFSKKYILYVNPLLEKVKAFLPFYNLSLDCGPCSFAGLSLCSMVCKAWVRLDGLSPQLTLVASHFQIFFKKFIIFYCMSVCLYTRMCTTCVRLPWRVEKKLDPWELELQTVVSDLM